MDTLLYVVDIISLPDMKMPTYFKGCIVVPDLRQQLTESDQPECMKKTIRQM